MLVRKTNAAIVAVSIFLTTVLTLTYLSHHYAPTPSSSSSSSSSSTLADEWAAWESPPIIPPDLDLTPSDPDPVQVEEVVKVKGGDGSVHILPVHDLTLPASLTNPHIPISPPPSPDSKTKAKGKGKGKDLLGRSLDDFLARPILSYEDALERDIEACPLAVHDRQVNPDQLKGERENWRNIGDKEVKERRESLVDGLRELQAEGERVVWTEEEGEGAGRGIVVAGGNRDTTARLLALLRILRNELHSDLPVHVFHFPGEITSASEREEIEGLGGTLFEFEGVQRLNIWKNFQIKALSILKSTFSEVLYLDSDNIPLKDPAHLFENELYLEGGKAVFWPDINKDHPENAIFRILGETCNHYEWQIDSGQILIDKRGNGGLNLAALHLAGLMQKDHEFWFKLSGGDKDTFRYAFHMLDIPFVASPRWLSSAGSLNPHENNRFCGNTMLQYDLPPYTDTPLFLHANLLKHASGVHPGSTFTHIKSAVDPLAVSDQLDGARMWVYNGVARGMCVDLEVEDGEVSLVSWEQGKGLSGLEDMFYQNGGRAGGW